MHNNNPQSVEKQPLKLNQKMTNATTYLSSKLDRTSIDVLDPNEITYIQAYLEQIKIVKLNSNPGQNTKPVVSNRDRNQVQVEFRNGHGSGTPQHYVDRSWSTNAPNSNQFQQQTSLTNDLRPNSSTRFGKKTANNDYYNDNVNVNSTSYYNPYEYGSKQNQLPPTHHIPYTGPYENNPTISGPMGLTDNLYSEKFPGKVRNVNVESTLMQREMTHLPGQREITESEVNRFELLPFDPQDTKHIVWTDNMPRGGYSSRNAKLELF